MAYEFYMTFPSESPVDYAGLLREKLTINQTLYNDELKSTKNTAQVTLVFNQDLVDKFLNADGKIGAQIVKDGANIFTGYVEPVSTFNFANGLDLLDLKLIDRSLDLDFILDEIIITDSNLFQGTGKVLVDEILNQAQTPITKGSLDIPSGELSRKGPVPFRVEEGQKAFDVLRDLLFEHGYFFYFDESGLFRIGNLFTKKVIASSTIKDEDLDIIDKFFVLTKNNETAFASSIEYTRSRKVQDEIILETPFIDLKKEVSERVGESTVLDDPDLIDRIVGNGDSEIEFHYTYPTGGLDDENVLAVEGESAWLQYNESTFYEATNKWGCKGMIGSVGSPTLTKKTLDFSTNPVKFLLIGTGYSTTYTTQATLSSSVLGFHCTGFELEESRKYLIFSQAQFKGTVFYGRKQTLNGGENSKIFYTKYLMDLASATNLKSVLDAQLFGQPWEASLRSYKDYDLGEIVSLTYASKGLSSSLLQVVSKSYNHESREFSYKLKSLSDVSLSAPTVLSSSGATVTPSPTDKDGFIKTPIIGASLEGNVEPSATGLYFLKDSFGYWDGGQWRTKFSDDGSFLLDPPGTGKLEFDGDTLSLEGEITATSGSFTGNVSAGGVVIGPNGIAGTGFNLNNSGMTASSGKIGGWDISGTTLESNDKTIELDPDTQRRITIKDSSLNPKVVIGYLNGLPDYKNGGTLGASDYGLWADSGNRISFNSEVEVTGNLSMLDQNLTLRNSSGEAVVVLGSVNGENGVHGPNGLVLTGNDTETSKVHLYNETWAGQYKATVFDLKAPNNDVGGFFVNKDSSQGVFFGKAALGVARGMFFGETKEDQSPKGVFLQNEDIIIKPQTNGKVYINGIEFQGSGDFLPLSGGTLTGTLNFGSYGDIYSDSTWLRLNQGHSQNIYTPRMIRADGGFQVDGKWVVSSTGNTLYENGTALSSKYAPISHTHSQYALTSHTHSYLPLSGGTVSGNLTTTGAEKAGQFYSGEASTNSTSYSNAFAVGEGQMYMVFATSKSSSNWHDVIFIGRNYNASSAYAIHVAKTADLVWGSGVYCTMRAGATNVTTYVRWIRLR